MIELEVVPYQSGDHPPKNSYIVSSSYLWSYRIICFISGLMLGIVATLVIV